MAGFIRYQLISYMRSLKAIPPLTIFGGWVFVLYAYKQVPILSSYAVTSIAIYLIMAWVAIGIFSIEEESEKHILLIALRNKFLFLLGKWIICFIVALLLMVFSIVYPIVMNNFSGVIKPVHIGLTIYSHFFLAMLGILVGSFFSVASFASRKYTWLSTVLVIVVTLAYEGIVERAIFMKWILLFLPPVSAVIKFLNGNDTVQISNDFWIRTSFILVYTLIGFIAVALLFWKKER